jgi:hypothetical protein
MPKHAGDWRNKPSRQSSKPYKGGHKTGICSFAIPKSLALGVKHMIMNRKSLGAELRSIWAETAR